MPRGQKTTGRTRKRKPAKSPDQIVIGLGTEIPAGEPLPQETGIWPEVSTGRQKKRSTGRRKTSRASASQSTAKRSARGGSKTRGKSPSAARKKPSGGKTAKTRARKSRATSSTLRKR
ncbi:MAG TPA: hypothetical protein PKG54_13860 [Phycisphaerae bacterium]|nr:hypothetical protein [Phycisphaerae bacterium]HOB75597.1 hypothetical protein [Phycisphaerae bacterium]HOJ55133.1 hypothetical protein [Phycisphaerae bacterium]HOL27335.1 hypothetical protein [Phycisphaerae bacterium]HPP20725.1 hypothetical protein [Phycisphaerae bacterium]